MKYFYFNKKWLLNIGCVFLIVSIGQGARLSQEAEHLDQQIESLQQEKMQPLSSAQNTPHTKMQSNTDHSHSSIHAPESNNVRTLNQSAFQEAMQNAMPLSPEQIIQLKDQFYQRRAAVASLPNMPPKPIIASRYVNLAPGSVPMVVRLAQGYVSTLTFLDQTGQIWPIDSYNIGDPQAFNVQWDKQSNLMMLQATTLYNTGNLAVKLKGLNVPVMLTLVTGQKAVDYRLDLRVQGNGPNAKSFLGRDSSSISSELLSILDGIPPRNHKLLQVSGGEASAWLVKDRLYMRTCLTVLSPAWLSTLSSPDGMKAYELPNTPFILVSDQHGKTVQLKISEL